jgi:hypothetical protein
MEAEYIKVTESPPPNVNVADVNCEDHNDLCSTLGITEFPQIRFYQNGL